MAANYKRILILKPSALGDIVLALPALSALRTSFPQAEISWLVSPEFSPLLQGHPHLNELIPFDRKQMSRFWFGLRGMQAVKSLVQELKHRCFDVTFDFQGLLRTALASQLSGATVRLGPANAREGAPWFYSEKVTPQKDSMHLVDHYLKMVETAGGTRPGKPEFVLPHDEEAAEAVRVLLAEQDVTSGRYAVLVPGSAHADKCWPEDRFGSLADRLRKRYHLAVVATGSAEEEGTIRRLRSLSRTRVANLAGSTDLRQLTALLRGASLVVSNDTGPGHLAAGLGVPLVMLFSWSNPARIYPYGRPECMAAIEPFGRGEAIRSRDSRHNVVNVGLEEVWDKVTQQLGP